MSKQVDLTKPLSDEDRKYLADRGQWEAIRTADMNAGAQSDDPAPDPTATGVGDVPKGTNPEEVNPASEEAREAAEDDATWVESLTVDQLKEVITRKDPESDLKGMKKPDLQAELLAILEDEESGD
jgi:hypothetical protein